MIPQLFKELIDKLIKGTELKKITWGKTSRDSEFKAVFGSSMVTVDNWPSDLNGIECVDLAIWNSLGERISSIIFYDNDRDRVDYQELYKLYSLARDSYYKVDETIAEIMSQLDF